MSGFASYLLKYKKLFKSRFFLLFQHGMFLFLKYKEVLFLKYKKSFFWENTNFLFLFFELGLKHAPGSYLAKCSIIDVWKCSEYASGSKYARVLNIQISQNIRKTFLKKIQGSSVLWKLEKLFWENIRNFPEQFVLGKNIRNFFKEKFWGLRPKSIKKFLLTARKFHFLKYRKKIFWENIWHFLREKLAGARKCTW